MAGEDERDGICGGAPPALVTRGGRTVFAASGRTPLEVLAALRDGAPVDPREAALAEAWHERHAADVDGLL
ncbi:MAG TPA: hypothetical protein VLB47_04090 [Solirubrobacteraceae bacterium]|nr:hypothetical protein [Solirubrobacteraceae bacterium]